MRKMERKTGRRIWLHARSQHMAPAARVPQVPGQGDRGGPRVPSWTDGLCAPGAGHRHNSQNLRTPEVPARMQNVGNAVPVGPRWVRAA